MERWKRRAGQRLRPPAGVGDSLERQSCRDVGTDPELQQETGNRDLYVISTDSGAQISERSLFQSLEYRPGAAEIHHIGLHGLRHDICFTLVRGVDIAVVEYKFIRVYRNVTTTYTTFSSIIGRKR